MADIDKLLATDNTVDNKKADAKAVYDNATKAASGDDWLSEMQSKLDAIPANADTGNDVWLKEQQRKINAVADTKTDTGTKTTVTGVDKTKVGDNTNKNDAGDVVATAPQSTTANGNFAGVTEDDLREFRESGYQSLLEESKTSLKATNDALRKKYGPTAHRGVDYGSTKTDIPNLNNLTPLQSSDASDTKKGARQYVQYEDESGDITYRVYDDGHTWKMDTKNWKVLSHKYPNGDIDQYDDNGNFLRRDESAHVPYTHFNGDKGGIARVLAEPLGITGYDAVNLWNNLRHDEKDAIDTELDKMGISSKYKGAYAGLSESECRAELARQESRFKSAASDAERYDAARRVTELWKETQAKALGFADYKSAYADPGMYDYKRWILWHPEAADIYKFYKDNGTPTSVLINDDGFHTEDPNIYSDALNNAIDKGYLDKWVLSNDDIPTTNYVNAFLKSNGETDSKKIGRYWNRVAARAALTGIPMDDLIKRDYERWEGLVSRGIDQKIEDKLNEAVEWLQKEHPYFTPFYFGTRGSMIGKLIEGGKRLFGYDGWDSDYINKLDKLEAAYREKSSFGADLGMGFTSLGMDLPLIIATGGASEAAVGADFAANRIASQVITFTAINVAGQAASDFQHGEISGPDAYVMAHIHGFVSGAMLGAGGELSQALRLTPSSYARIATNKIVGNLIETTAFSVPSWVEASYAGELTPGSMVRIFGENACIVGGLKMTHPKKTLDSWKKSWSKSDLAQLRDAGYEELADDIKNDRFSYYDEETGTIKLFEGAEAHIERLMQDMSGRGKGVSWGTYNRVLNLMGRQAIPPSPANVSMNKGKDGKYVVTLTDVTGKVIAEKTFDKKSEAKKDLDSLNQSIEHAKEIGDIAQYEANLEAMAQEEALTRVADALNGDNGWLKDENGDYVLDSYGRKVPDPDFDAHTPETVIGMLNDILAIPKEQRTQQQREILEYYESQREDVLSGSVSSDDIMTMVCEQYGVDMDKVIEVGTTDPKERKKMGKAADAYAAYCDIIRRGPISTARPTGIVTLHDGRTIEVYNTPDMGNKQEAFYYKDADGSVKMVSTKEVKTFTPTSNDSQRLFDASTAKYQAKGQQFADTISRGYDLLSDDGLDSTIARLEKEYAANKNRSNGDMILIQLEAARRARDARRAAKVDETKDETTVIDETTTGDNAVVKEDVVVSDDTTAVGDTTAKEDKVTGDTTVSDDTTGGTGDATGDVTTEVKADDTGTTDPNVPQAGEQPFPEHRPKVPDTKPEDMTDDAIAKEIEAIRAYDRDERTIEMDRSLIARRDALLAEQERRKNNPPEPQLKEDKKDDVKTEQKDNDVSDDKKDDVTVGDDNKASDEVKVEPKDKIDELLDVLGLTGDMRDEQRARYERYPKEFERDYEELMPKDETSASDTKDNTTDDTKDNTKDSATDDTKDNNKDDTKVSPEPEPDAKEPELVDDLDAPMPTDKKGETDFLRASPRRAHKHIYEDMGFEKEDADEFVAYKKNAAKDALSKLEKKKPKLSDKGINGNEYKWREALEKWEEAKAALSREIKYWDDVKNTYTEREIVAEIESTHNTIPMRDLLMKLRRIYRNDSEIMQVLNHYEPKNLYEEVVQYLCNSGVRFLWDSEGNKKGLMQELGWKEGERKKAIGMLADSKHGGMSLQGHAHRLWEMLDKDRYSDVDVYETMSQVLHNTVTRGNIHALHNEMMLKEVRDILAKRADGEVITEDEQIANDRARYDFINEHRDELGDNPTDEEVDALFERIQREEAAKLDEEPDDPANNIFGDGGDDVPFQKGNIAAPAAPKTRQARNFTARTIKKLRKIGVSVKTASRTEAERMKKLAQQVNAQFQMVWHGSAKKYDAFDHSHMGEGEGAQAYGWGTYVTQVMGIAKTYAKSNAIKSGGIKYKGAETQKEIEKLFPDQNPDTKPLSREVADIMADMLNGYSFEEAMSYAEDMKVSRLKRVQHDYDTYKEGLAAKQRVIDRLENMDDAEYAKTNLWDEAVIASESSKEEEFAYRRAAATRNGLHKGRELTREELIEELKNSLRDSKINIQPDYESALADAQAAYDFVKGLKKRDFEMPEGGRYLYEVEIPDNNGINYIPYNDHLSLLQLRIIGDALESDGWTVVRGSNDLPRYEKDGVSITLNPRATGADVYEELSQAFGALQPTIDPRNARRGAPMLASDFLHKCGFVGIEYPSQFRSGGRSDGAKNYVIFNEGNAKIINRTEFLTTSDGKVYGWHDNEGIHLTEDGFNPDTPLHEYTHGFMEMLRRIDVDKYNRIVSGLRESEVWKEVLDDPEYQHIKDNEVAVASEVAARLSGRENARRVKTEFDFSKGNIFTTANAIAALERAKNALRDFWDTVAEWFGAKLDKAVPADRFARMTLRALDKGVNPDAVLDESDIELMAVDTKSDAYKKKVSDAAKRVEKRLAELNRLKGEQSLISDNENRASIRIQENEPTFPPKSGDSGAVPDAKVNKKLQDANKLAIKTSDFIDKLSNGNDINVENFAVELVKELEIPEQNHDSQYAHFVSQDGDKVTLRVSDHHGKARNIIINGVKTDRGVSIVLRTEDSPESKFKATKWAKVDEYVYDNPDKQRLIDISKSIFGLFDSGEYIDLAKADEVKTSPKEGTTSTSDKELQIAKGGKDSEQRFRTSDQLFEQYPTWLSGQTTDSGQHTTQITSTVKSYNRIGEWMKKNGMDGATVLDASSGLGIGTQSLREQGFNVEDVEPYPSKDREAPTYSKYEDIDKKYDVVISNAVLNVIPDDWRADVLKSTADKLKVGGKLIINVRDAKSIADQKQKIELDSPSEILVTDSKGNIRAYQKGFTKKELKEWVESELGEGWEVEIANEKNSGLKSGVAVVVTKGENAAPVRYRTFEPIGERGVKKVTKVREPEYREATDYFGNPTTLQTRSAEYKVEGMDDTFYSIEEAADAVRRRNPDYCVYIDDNGNIALEAWSNLLPDGVKPNTFAKVIAMSGGNISNVMKKRIAKYAEREMGEARKKAEALTQELGLDVEFHDDPSEFSGRKSRAKGWYDPKTGKIHVVMGNHSGVGDVMATMLHEGVAHHGLRKLFGEDFDNFLDNVYNHAEESIITDINAKIGKLRAEDEKNGESHSDDYYRRAATEEYIAELSEDGLYNAEQHSNYAMRAWNWIKEKFMEMLRGRGFNPELMDITDDKLRYTLWKSHQNLRQSVIDVAKDAVLKDKAGIKDFVEEGEPVRKVAEGDALFRDGEEDTARDFGAEFRDLMRRRLRGENVDAELDALFRARRAAESGDTTADTGDVSDNGGDTTTGGGDGNNGGVTPPAPPAPPAPELPPTDFDRAMTPIEQAQAAAIKAVNDTKASLEQRNAARRELGRSLYDLHNQIKDLASYGDKVDAVKAELQDLKSRYGTMPRSEYRQRKAEIEKKLNRLFKGKRFWKGLGEVGDEIEDNGNFWISNTLRQVEAAQREYDRATVENVVSLCKMMVQSGLIDRSYVSNLTPLFTKLKDATGKQDLTSTVNDIMDVMLKSQERSVRNELAKLLNTKAQKVNQSGVVTQAGLDIRGQRTLQALKDNIGNQMSDIDNYISRLEEERGRVPSGHQERVDEIDDKIFGAMLAKQYIDTVNNNANNVRLAEEELASLKARYKAGELGLKEYTEQKHAQENLIRSYRMAHADAMWRYVNDIHSIIAEGKSRAKDWIEQQKEHQNDIRHNAYSDMEGTSKQTQGDPTAMQKLMNSSIPRFFSSSLYTLQTMLKSLGNKHAMGEGYLYNRFFRGWMEQRDAEITEYRDDMNTLNAKAKELTGHSYFGIYKMIQKLPKMTVEYMDGGEMLPHDLDQGQLGYAYMVNKMEDGAAALRNMGITEAKMEEISNFLNPKLREFYDWLQDEFLAGKWEGMNEVHKRMFGADMDRVENYIPLQRDRGAAKQEVDISQDNEAPLSSTVVGSIIKRVHSNLGIDLKHNNAIDVVANHLLEATHWKHFSEWVRDANTLLSDTTFRNKVKNSTTIHGSGDILWNKLNQVFKIAGGDYKPKAHSAGVDKAIVDMARTVNTAKVSMRVFTAIKQLLSLPVFATECNTATLLKNVAFLLSPVTSKNVAQNSFLWCLRNLPQFRERWVSRTSGETRLENGDLGWGYSRQKVLEMAGRIGLTPNAFIDACTVAAGAKSIYEKRYAQYRKDGYSDVAADKKAKIDAETAFNESQQSSERAFVSPIQVDRTAVALGLSTFRNASMGFERKFVDSIRNFRHLTDHKETVTFMQKQMERDGLTETQAKAAAERLYRRALWRSTLNFLMFGFGAQMAWNVGGKLPYLIFGDNDEEKNNMVKQAAVHAGIGGWLEGLPAGDILSEGMTNWAMNLIDNGNPLEGTSFFEFDPDLLTVTSDFVKVTKAIEGKNPLKGATDFINLLGQIYTGVNPQTFTDAGVAIYDACDGDPQVGNEALMCILRILQCPQSQLDQMYIDELKMSARDAQKLSPEDVARRYAYYKAHKDTPYLWWIYNQNKKDEIVKKYEGDFNKKLNTDVKKAGGTAEDYYDLRESATTNKKKDEYKKKEIDALSAQGPAALVAAWEREKAKGDNADYKYMRSLMSRYQKDVYKEEKMPTAQDVADYYTSENGVDLEKLAEKIGRDLGFSSQDSYYQMSQFKTKNTSANNKTIAKFRELGCSFKYSENGEFFDMDEYNVKLPVKDKETRAKAIAFVTEHNDELKRIYRNGWRMKKIESLYKKADELRYGSRSPLAPALPIAYDDPVKLSLIYGEIQTLINDEADDRASGNQGTKLNGTKGLIIDR